MKKANMVEYFNGKRYGIVSIPLHKTKLAANQRATRYRAAGRLARVLKIDKGKYAVYSREK